MEEIFQSTEPKLQRNWKKETGSVDSGHPMWLIQVPEKETNVKEAIIKWIEKITEVKT